MAIYFSNADSVVTEVIPNQNGVRTGNAYWNGVRVFEGGPFVVFGFAGPFDAPSARTSFNRFVSVSLTGGVRYTFIAGITIGGAITVDAPNVDWFTDAAVTSSGSSPRLRLSSYTQTESSRTINVRPSTSNQSTFTGRLFIQSSLTRVNPASDTTYGIIYQGAIDHTAVSAQYLLWVVARPQT